VTTWLAGMRITADRLNDNTIRSTTTTGLTASTGYTVSAVSGRKVSGLTTVNIFITRSGADVTATSGNIAGDPQIGTLPSGWRPPELVNIQWGNGAADGEGTIDTTGAILIRSANGNIVSGTNLRVYTTWISENA
jgi:hypothetical protein